MRRELASRVLDVAERPVAAGLHCITGIVRDASRTPNAARKALPRGSERRTPKGLAASNLGASTLVQG
jgi:hypothetical protein